MPDHARTCPLEDPESLAPCNCGAVDVKMNSWGFRPGDELESSDGQRYVVTRTIHAQNIVGLRRAPPRTWWRRLFRWLSPRRIRFRLQTWWWLRTRT